MLLDDAAWLLDDAAWLLDDAAAPVGDVTVMPGSPNNGTSGRHLLFAAASATIVAVFAFAVWNRSAIDTPVNTAEAPEDATRQFDPAPVLEGETVLRQDPLVVLAAPPAELNFDPSGLGIEIALDPIADLPQSEIDEQIDSLIAEVTDHSFPAVEDLQVRKMTLMGTDEDLLSGAGVVDGVLGESPDSEPVFGVPGSTFRLDWSFGTRHLRCGRQRADTPSNHGWERLANPLPEQRRIPALS